MLFFLHGRRNGRVGAKGGGGISTYLHTWIHNLILGILTKETIKEEDESYCIDVKEEIYKEPEIEKVKG